MQPATAIAVVHDGSALVIEEPVVEAWQIETGGQVSWQNADVFPGQDRSPVKSQLEPQVVGRWLSDHVDTLHGLSGPPGFAHYTIPVGAHLGIVGLAGQEPGHTHPGTG